MTETKKYYHARYRFEGDNVDRSIILDVHPYEWVKKENEKIKSSNTEVYNIKLEIQEKCFSELRKIRLEAENNPLLWNNKYAKIEDYLSDIYDLQGWHSICNPNFEYRPCICFIDWKEISKKEYRSGLEAFSTEEKHR